MADEDWYRNTVWSPAIERAFLDRLARARVQRGQYLAIQALTLAAHRPDVALALVERYFAAHAGGFDDGRALWARARAHLARGDTRAATTAYREVLDGPAPWRGAVALEYAHEVALRGIEAEYAQARALLDGAVGLTFPVERFLWHAAHALLDGDRVAAQAALRAARERDSGLRHHPDLGLVDARHEATLARLAELVGGR